MVLTLRWLALICILTLLANTNILIENKTKSTAQTININDGWQYYEDNTPSLADLKGLTPIMVDLPHTWNTDDVMDPIPGYRRDASWYQKTIKIDANKGERTFLSFEGANMSTEVYVNGQKAGVHVGGYVGFDIELTPLIKDGENTIAIRVDNGYNPDVIPSQKADFFIYGGITRDLWLKTVPNTYIKRSLISTPEVSKSKASTLAQVHLEGELLNHSLKVIIFEKGSNKPITEISKKVTQNLVYIQLPQVNNPKLWSPSSPYLYEVVTELYQGKDKIHTVRSDIGYRWYSFDPNGPFYLNGERLLLRGTHRHEEHAGVGAAMSNEQHRDDIAMIKEVGANFLRLGHYPQDPEVYKACNELGIIVWDELPWCRGGMGEAEWQANTERLLEEQILQNFNHPSICFWSLGNEIYWLPDFEGGDDKDRMNVFLKKLNDKSHQLDPNRMTAIRKYYDGSDLVDVFSPSIWSGWYAGVYTNYEETIKENQKLYPRFLHMEYGGSSHVGRHAETPIKGSGSINEKDWAEVSNQVKIDNIAKNGDWTENYIVDLFDWHLKVTETSPIFTGNAQWAFKDFGTPLRPENPIPYMNQKGLVDRNGNPKDAFYVFKSYWSDKPFAYIESHTWTYRIGPQGKAREVNVYSNCEEVELLVNNVSLGKKKRDINVFPAMGLVWDVQFKEGANDMKAIGYNAGKKVSDDAMMLTYTYNKPGDPDDIVVSYEVAPNGKYFIIATMVDKNGNRVLDYEQKVYFTINGSGSLVKYQGTPQGSDIIAMANGRAMIEFIPGKGKAVIEVRNQDFKGSYLVFDPAQIEVKNISIGSK